jgi:hypothetical protein
MNLSVNEHCVENDQWDYNHDDLRMLQFPVTNKSEQVAWNFVPDYYLMFSKQLSGCVVQQETAAGNRDGTGE